ncbi:hypothetical protein FJR48_11260 [Sulfurimonas lithotrophica]|uniref:Uncharacterized protein n=1 Tax=Sulfurimonas lithotrophica TaxID=2590022 RepID=A0A5P8P3L9_9BACT|nr:hypothetical protein [Sulfurimonas lithotrophica]QFR50275.1 hypothetical protein FJR48_11260 [Sulfurimonas lithotrophica]
MKPKSNKLLIEHIKKYTTFEWLVFIKALENTSDEELLKIEPNQMERYNLQNSNWYSKLLDLALRLSDYEKTRVILDRLPKTQDYRKFIKLYLESYDSESNFKADLDYSLDLAFTKYLYEQNKHYAPPVNSMGRLIELYSTKEPLFREFFGLTPKQILYFFTLNNAKHNIYEPFDFTNMLRLIKDYDNKITETQLKKFLDTFSKSIKDYRLEARDLGITKNTMKSIRLIEQYPIIKLNNDYYLIASKNILLEALSYKIFTILHKEVKNSENFKQSFGNTFENYLRNLTKSSHSEYFYECDDLVKEEGNRKAEFYIVQDNTSILIESKLLHIDENIILHASAIDLEKKFKNTIFSALEQIDSCFKKIDVQNKYAVIVIHTHMPLLENFIRLFKHKSKYDFLDNVMILSVVDYEIMIHNPFEKIIEYFEMPYTNKKSQIALYFEKRNKFLEASCMNINNDLKNKFA